jgi:imidazolonepropionase-like amidohydrolase
MAKIKFILAGHFIDGSGGAIRKNICLVVRDGIITDRVEVETVAGMDPASIDDFRHCTILPPLVDCSLVLSTSGTTDLRERRAMEQADYEQRVQLISRNIHYCHSHGVLGVATDDNDGFVGRYRDGAEDGSAIAIKTGKSPDESKKKTADFARIVCSPDIVDVSAIEDFSSCCSGGIPLFSGGVVVANGERCVAQALAQGCGAVEQGYFMGNENLEYMAKAGVLWIPSMLKAKTALQEATGARKFFLQKALQMQYANLKIAAELGVTAAVGSGAGSSGIIHGESVVEEMKLFLRAGYSLVQTLQCASFNGARFFNMEGLGLLRVGQPATFLISRGMVQQLPRKLLYLEGIYINGSPSEVYRKNPVKTVFSRE